MPPLIAVGRMLAGIAFLLLALNFMEGSLRHLAGRNFKLYLRKQTQSKIKAIGSGALFTGMLQSSSIVNLLVLSMTGAGVLRIQNALALILGANLGSTFNSWLVALFGFDLAVEQVALVTAGLAGIFMTFTNEEGKYFLVYKLLFGLSLLFISLGFVKSGMESLTTGADLSFLSDFPVLLFFITGILFTALVQTSSVTMAITLSGLYTGVISFYGATAIILGSEIGTTLKLFLASANGQAVKKRVALGNFLFNFITAILFLIFLWPVNRLITGLFGEDDQLLALVFFQSLINILSIVLFFPFLRQFGSYLMKRYKENEEEGFYISKIPVGEPDIATDALKQEVRHFINLVINYSLCSFGKDTRIPGISNIHKAFYGRSQQGKYEYIKQLYGEMHGFYLRILAVLQKPVNARGPGQLASAMRNAMYAAKSIRDVQHDIEQTRNSTNDTKYNFYKQSEAISLHIYEHLFEMVNKNGDDNYFKDLTSLYHSVTTGYADTLQFLYKDKLAGQVNETEISTLLNFNRELYTSYKSLIFSLKDFLLSAGEAEFFDNQPGFIR